MEISFAVIAMFAVIFLIVGAPRVTTNRGSVHTAASAAARAAAGARNQGEANALANEAAAVVLADSCASTNVVVQGWAPGNTLTAIVTCYVSMDDVASAGFEDQNLTATATERVETVRGS